VHLGLRYSLEPEEGLDRSSEQSRREQGVVAIGARVPPALARPVRRRARRPPGPTAARRRPARRRPVRRRPNRTGHAAPSSHAAISLRSARKRCRRRLRALGIDARRGTRAVADDPVSTPGRPDRHPDARRRAPGSSDALRADTLNGCGAFVPHADLGSRSPGQRADRHHVSLAIEAIVTRDSLRRFLRSAARARRVPAAERELAGTLGPSPLGGGHTG